MPKPTNRIKTASKLTNGRIPKLEGQSSLKGKIGVKKLGKKGK